MRRVILESPYGSDPYFNVAYARLCLHHSLSLGEAPIASHLLYTQPAVLRDNDKAERQKGIDAGHAWISVADAMVVYQDHGISAGMQLGIDRAVKAGLTIEYREIGVVSREDNMRAIQGFPVFDGLFDYAPNFHNRVVY